MSYYEVSFQSVRFLPKHGTVYFVLGCVTVFDLFALTRECALHLRPCEKTPETYFAGGLAGYSKTIWSVPE